MLLYLNIAVRNRWNLTFGNMRLLRLLTLTFLTLTLQRRKNSDISGGKSHDINIYFYSKKIDILTL